MTLKEIDDSTTTVEDFIAKCLEEGYDHDTIHEYLRTEHKG